MDIWPTECCRRMVYRSAVAGLRFIGQKCLYLSFDRPPLEVHQLPRAKREAKKKRPFHTLPRAKREAKKSLVNKLPRATREAKKTDWSSNCLEQSERLRRRGRSTNCLERSERLRRETGPPIASSEARG